MDLIIDLCINTQAFIFIDTYEERQKGAKQGEEKREGGNMNE